MQATRHPVDRRLRTALALVAAHLLSVAAWPCLADEEAAAARRRWFDPQRYVDKLRRAAAGLKPPEIVEMVSAIGDGSKLGPGEAWFHAGQSRYGWDWLQARYDANGDSSICQEEFGGPFAAFQRLDRNRDGDLEADDLDWSEDAAFEREAGQARQWFRSIDASSNGRISRQEWDNFFAKAAGDGQYLTPDDLRAALNPPEPPTTAPDGPSPLVFVKGLLSGELGSVFEGPAVGEPAPDFVLPTHDGRQEIRLSQYRGHKPLVLVFGSFT